MTDWAKKKQALIDEVIAREETMFVHVPARETVDCQRQLRTFRAMREMAHSVLATDTLESYLDDLRTAERMGHNMMTEKYARMERPQTPQNENALIDPIIAIEWQWMTELHARFPNAIRLNGGFVNYAAAELATYSDRTLKLYHRDIFTAFTVGVNLIERRYGHLYQSLGFDSLAEVEMLAARRLKNDEAGDGDDTRRKSGANH